MSYPPAKPKPFSWSYSRLTAFELCPRRYDALMVSKSIVETESEQQLHGNRVHANAAEFLRGNLPDLEPKFLHDYARKMMDDTARMNARLVVEKQYAFTPTMKPTTWFGDDVWLRVIVDAAMIAENVALMADWKTGRFEPNSPQLEIFALAIFAMFPEVQAVKAEYVWIKETTTSHAIFKRQDIVGILAGVLPRVRRLEVAHATKQFDPKPNHLCRKWCPVVTCAHHGGKA